jgi:hypothetical protein
MQSPHHRRAFILMTTMMVFTFSRVSVVTYFPHLEMYGGIDSNAWFAPWVSDTILGLLVPVMLYLLWRKTGAKVWAALIVYNALGAFDYSHGLATQWHYPQMTEGAVSAVLYTAMGLGMIFNLGVVLMMFRGDVMRHFLKQSAE